MNLNLKYCWGGQTRRSGGTKDGNDNKGNNSNQMTARVGMNLHSTLEGGSSSDQTPTTSQDGSSTNPNNQSGSTSVGGSYEADGVSLPPQQQVYLKDLFEKDAGILQDLGHYLDRRSLVIKNHEHLADLLKAPPFIKAKCKSNTEHSPTLDLLQHPQVSKLSVNKLVTTLRNMENNNVANIIEANIPENRQQSVKNALNGHAEVFEEKVASELDKNAYNWQKLGGKLGISKDELHQIEMGCNPAKQLLGDYAYQALEQEKLTVECFRQHITAMKRHDILALLDEFKITQQDNGRSIRDVINPDSEEMWKLCLLLNKDVHGSVKDWKNLAYLWDIEPKVYSQFKPPTRVSPTKILLEEWLITERPKFTANALCSLLGKIQRNDAKEFLEAKLKNIFRDKYATESAYDAYDYDARVNQA